MADTKYIDGLITEWREIEIKKAEIESQLSEVNGEINRVKTDLLKVLIDAEKSNYNVAGLGTVSVVNSMRVTTPKTIEQKQDLWDYITEKYGVDAAFGKFGVNYATLNRFYKDELEAHDGPKSLFKVPGLDDPQPDVSLRFRKGK
jgi:hypothetical protein